ncbi:hypothetical protein BJ546DRAFT_1101911 [Cryomyces antarcticus]
MPSLQIWQQAIDPSDIYFNSSVIELRNQHYPPGNTNTSNYYSSSKGMGEMTIAAHQFYRRGSGLFNRQLGPLYWQLEDIWQAPTWAGIEYDGRWEVLHYVAKDIYQPVIISPSYNRTTGDLQVYVTSDLWTPATGSANFSWYDWSGTQLNISTPIGHDLTNVIMKVETTVEGRLSNSNTATTFRHENWFHPAPLSQAKLVDPGPTLSSSNCTKNFTVQATTGAAAWVWLDNPTGTLLNFDSSGFWLLPNQTGEVSYALKNDTTGGE